VNLALHCGQTSVIVSALASTLTTIGAPGMCVRKIPHEAGVLENQIWRCRSHFPSFDAPVGAGGEGALAIGVWDMGASSGPRALQVSIEPIEEARSDVDLIGTSEKK